MPLSADEDIRALLEQTRTIAMIGASDRPDRPSNRVMAMLQRHGGSISAEHGIGLVKKPYLDSTRSAAEIALMRGVRRVFDPNGIMNPGKLFDDPA